MKFYFPAIDSFFAPQQDPSILELTPMKMNLVVCILFSLSIGSTALAQGLKIQSKFLGPINLKVWEQYNDSWNVELTDKDSYKFQLTRSTVGKKKEIELLFFSEEQIDAPVARLSSVFRERTDQWRYSIDNPGVLHKTKGELKEPGVYQFKWSDVEDCFDENAKRFVEKLSFEISNVDESVYAYEVHPMVVRGKDMAIWNEKVTDYENGKGDIGYSSFLELDFTAWMGTDLLPILSYVRQLTMPKGSEVGLHRHLHNQEMFLVQSGEVEVAIGVAKKSSKVYSAKRKLWSTADKEEHTKEFAAKGGWIEYRVLSQGECAVLVPKRERERNGSVKHDGDEIDSVFFHGAKAKSDARLWQMGSDN